MRVIAFLVAVSFCSLTTSSLGAGPANKTGDIAVPYFEHGELHGGVPEPAPRIVGPLEEQLRHLHQQLTDMPVKPWIVGGHPVIKIDLCQTGEPCDKKRFRREPKSTLPPPPPAPIQGGGSSAEGVH